MNGNQSGGTDYKKVIEAALFVSGRAMDTDEIAKVSGIASVGHVKKLMEELIVDYQNKDIALVITKVGDKYILGVRNEYAEKVSSLAGTPDLSKSALRILAYISKNEPVMQSAVVKAFGSSTYE